MQEKSVLEVVAGVIFWSNASDTEASGLQRAWAVYAPIEGQGRISHGGGASQGNEEHHAPYEIRQRHSKTSAPEMADGIHR